MVNRFWCFTSFYTLKNILFNYVPDKFPVYIRVANKQMVIRAGVGSIRVRTEVNGIKHSREIKDVWHVPEFAHSLLSLNQLKRQGCWYVSGRNGDMNDYFFDKDGQCWLISSPSKQNGLNIPNWKLCVAPQFKNIAAAVFPDTEVITQPHIPLEVSRVITDQ